MSLFNHTRNIFHLKNHKPFGYCNKEIQECFVINCGKGCLSDGHLRLIIEVYEKSEKRLKLTKKCQEITLCITLSVQHSVINCGKRSFFLNSENSIKSCKKCTIYSNIPGAGGRGADPAAGSAWTAHRRSWPATAGYRAQLVTPAV